MAHLVHQAPGLNVFLDFNWFAGAIAALVVPARSATSTVEIARPIRSAGPPMRSFEREQQSAGALPRCPAGLGQKLLTSLPELESLLEQKSRSTRMDNKVMISTLPSTPLKTIYCPHCHLATRASFARCIQCGKPLPRPDQKAPDAAARTTETAKAS